MVFQLSLFSDNILKSGAKSGERIDERINQMESNGIKPQGIIMNIDFEKEIESIAAQIIEKYKPEKIILFGSAVNGQLGLDSDVDLLVIKKDTPLYGADRIRELSRIIDRNIPVDFLVYRPEEFQKRLEMGDPFLKAVLKEGKVLYG
jgi:predicted nucleotidyltransferase